MQLHFFPSRSALTSFPARLLLPASKSRPRFESTLTIFFLFLALGSRDALAAGASDEIVLGMCTALTGSAQNLGKDMQRGVLAGLDRANRIGGVNGRKLRLISLDDGYEPTRTAPNIRQLIEKDNVLAIIGNVGSPTCHRRSSVDHRSKDPAFRPVLGQSDLAQ